jgi:hypothetical protein
MALSDALLQLARESLDTPLMVNGITKVLRFFNARDCRNYHDSAVSVLADEIEEAGVVTVGELVAREEANFFTCPKCEFNNSVANIVYAGEILLQRSQELTDLEAVILDKAREWLAADAISRCLDDDA